MTLISATLKKVNWENLLHWAITWVVVYYAVIATSEGNKMFWLGVLAFIAGLVGIANLEDRQSKWGSNAQLMMSLLSFVFALMSPFMHLDTNGVFANDKVWIADGKTTMSQHVVWRSPFSKFAVSVSKPQNVSFIVSGMTKDGTAVRAALSGEFSISGDEQVVIKHFSKMRDPDTETRDMLKKALQKSFEQVIATMTVADIATAKNNFFIEHAIVTLTAMAGFGFKESGSIIVSGLHPYIMDK